MHIFHMILKETFRFIALALFGAALMSLAKWLPGEIGYPEIAPIVNYIGGLAVILCTSYTVIVMIFPSIRLDDLSKKIKSNPVACSIVVFGILQIMGDIISVSGQIMGL